jgi:hypothetical protein
MQKFIMNNLKQLRNIAGLNQMSFQAMPAVSKVKHQ